METTVSANPKSFDHLNGNTVLGKDYQERGHDFISILLLLFYFTIMTTPTLTSPTSVHTAIISQDTTPQITLRPVQSINTIVEAYNEYNRLKKRLLTENDYQTIKGKTCIKKSGFRKLACAFGISTEITKENRINFEKYFIYEITVRATAPNGRFVETCASCSSIEKEFSHLENDVRATAQTRASNRAISDLIGGGEISAEELENPKTSSSQIISKVENKNPELMTSRQKQYLTKLIEIKYPDTRIRAKLCNRLLSLTKTEARSAIQKMLTIA